MITYERVKVAKQYIEKKYRLKKQEEEEISYLQKD